MQSQIQTDVHRADLALAQAIALDVDAKLRGARESLRELSALDDVRRGDSAAMDHAFRAFKAARRDIDRVYWFNPSGIMRVSVPENARTPGSDFSQRRLFQEASTANAPIIEAGIVDLTTYQAVAVVAEPRVLLLDEPLSNLDAKVHEAARIWLRDIQKRLGITAVYVTHDQAEALAMSDKIAVMHAGRVEQFATPQEV